MKLSSEDYIEILNLYGRYSYAVDFGNAETWADTYTPEGKFITPQLCCQGRNELIQYIKDCVASRGVGCRHITTNIVINGSHDNAVGSAYLTFVSRPKESDAGPGTEYFLRYEDRLKRTPEGWRFVERRVIAD